MKEKQRAEAVKRMKKLGMMAQPIKEFEKEGKLNRSEFGGILYWLNDEEQKMVDKFEQETGGLVYHVIHSYANIGETYNLLFVSKYEEEWEMDDEDIADGYALANVINLTFGIEEMGTIGIRESVGGLVRTC